MCWGKNLLTYGHHLHGRENISEKENMLKTTSTRHKYTRTRTHTHSHKIYTHVGFLPLYLVLVVSASPAAVAPLWRECPFDLRSDPYEDALLILDMPIAFTISR